MYSALSSTRFKRLPTQQQIQKVRRTLSNQDFLLISIDRDYIELQSINMLSHLRYSISLLPKLYWITLLYIDKWIPFNSYFVLTMHNVCSVIGQKRIVFLIFHRNLGLYLMSSWAVLTKNVIDAVAWDQSHMHSKLITWSKCCDVVFHVKEDYFHIVDLCCRAKIYNKYIMKMLLYFNFSKANY